MCFVDQTAGRLLFSGLFINSETPRSDRHCFLSAMLQACVHQRGSFVLRNAIWLRQRGGREGGGGGGGHRGEIICVCR